MTRVLTILLLLVATNAFAASSKVDQAPAAQTTSAPPEPTATDESDTPDQVIVESQDSGSAKLPQEAPGASAATPANSSNTANEEKLAKPGDIKDEVSRAMGVFVPSEQIDVDKPVDFPTNI